MKFPCEFHGWWLVTAAWVAGCCLTSIPSRAAAEVVKLKNGLEVQGAFGEAANLGSEALSPMGSTTSSVSLIRFVDDGLRRTYFSTYQVESRRPDVEQWEVIRVEQPVATTGRRLGLIGGLSVAPTPFDEYGRRIVTLSSDRGPLHIVQGITEVTPLYVRLQGLQAAQSMIWDARVATATIPKNQLLPVLHRGLDMQRPDDRLKLVRLFLQCELYGDAENELRATIEAFPELKEQAEQISELQRIRTRQHLQEVKLRFQAGQYQTAMGMLRAIPIDQLPVEVMVEVQSVSEELEKTAERMSECRGMLDELLATLQGDVMETELKELFQEMVASLSPHTLPRFTELLRSSQDTNISAEQRLALAISGWLTGGAAQDKPALSRSLIRVRSLVREFLVEPNDVSRSAAIETLASEEAGSPEWVAKVVASMPPLGRLPEPTPVMATEHVDEATPNPDEPTKNSDVAKAGHPVPGFLECEAPGLRPEVKVRYLVQLPPEYDPLRRYPVVMTLHRGTGTPEQQIDWWCGVYDANLGMRLGQAGRYGYIVIAPYWTRPKTMRYEYSPAEHAAVLTSLRDACHRFSIDTDRVFLSGHSAGGDAAWDLALAHPDLWAGVIPIGAAASGSDPSSPRYVTHYWPNAKGLPMFFVGGEKDTQRIEWNSTDWNRYLQRTGYNVMYSEYRGRGHEHFVDEVMRLFRWMEVHRRDFFPKEFEVVTRRPWDNFFWYIEMQGIPAQAIIYPAEWPRKDAARPFPLKASVRERSNVFLTCKAEEITVYLSPEMVDFGGSVTIRLSGRVKAKDIRPDTGVLLEDVRTRGDRQHPFWARAVLRN